jgi:hypothetical protein
VVAYVMTVRGPRPDSLIDAAIDYAHYLDRQLKPIAFSVAGACGWDPEGLFADSGQIGFDFG